MSDITPPNVDRVKEAEWCAIQLAFMTEALYACCMEAKNKRQPVAKSEEGGIPNTCSNLQKEWMDKYYNFFVPRLRAAHAGSLTRQRGVSQLVEVAGIWEASAIEAVIGLEQRLQIEVLRSRKADRAEEEGLTPFDLLAKLEGGQLIALVRQEFALLRDISKEGKTPSGTPREDICFSADFRSLRWGKEIFVFTTKQAAVLQALDEERHRGTPIVSAENLLQAAGSDGKRLLDLFRNKDGRRAWNHVIVSAGKGLFRLAAPAR